MSFLVLVRLVLLPVTLTLDRGARIKRVSSDRFRSNDPQEEVFAPTALETVAATAHLAENNHLCLNSWLPHSADTKAMEFVDQNADVLDVLHAISPVVEPQTQWLGHASVLRCHCSEESANAVVPLREKA